LKVPGNETSKERKIHVANWTGSYWNFRSRERIGPEAKRPGTLSIIAAFRNTRNTIP